MPGEWEKTYSVTLHVFNLILSLPLLKICSTILMNKSGPS